jgi:hypothetical protein
VTTLTIEVELLGLSQAAKEFLCISRLFEQLILRLNEPLELRCDNRQTIRLLTKDFAKLKTKLRHVDLYNHWLRQEIGLKHIELLWESFQRILADGLTKPLPPAKFAEFVKLLQIEDLFHKLEALEKAESIHERVKTKLAEITEGTLTEAFRWSGERKLQQGSDSAAMQVEKVVKKAVRFAEGV